MGWSIGFSSKWNRDIGYGVPAQCDHPDCEKQINRGLSHVCSAEQPNGDDLGCNLFFCSDHLTYNQYPDDHLCECCMASEGKVFQPSEDIQEWVDHKLNDDSWEEWRKLNPDWVSAQKCAIEKYTPEQKAWCEMYKKDTGFEAMMGEFEAGTESFHDAAQSSVDWFKDWSTDAYLKLNISIETL